MNTKTTATRLVLDTTNQLLEIDWADGHHSTYSLDGVRRACPCVTCQGGHAHMGSLPDPEVFTLPALMRWEKVRIEPVGSYAVRFIWDDGHDTGIYTWERLRRMCPSNYV